jgi:hypothetical protein
MDLGLVQGDSGILLNTWVPCKLISCMDLDLLQGALGGICRIPGYVTKLVLSIDLVLLARLLRRHLPNSWVRYSDF